MVRRDKIKMPELESINRINNLPIVETGWTYAFSIYNKIKNSNNLLSWTFDHAETSFYTVLDTASPAIFLLETPLYTLDKVLCRSLDLVENKIPMINLPPQMIYSNTRKYVTDVGSTIVKPVLKRADSVKQIGSSVLANKYTTFAADKIDSALNVADMYVDKYLPDDTFEGTETDPIKPVDGPTGKAVQASQHIYRFSKKLRRRLTRRTLLEAKALKDQSVEAIHVLVYVAELIATDPKLALQKGRELWGNLSHDEPENQARPENLEQLIVLLTRETARRIVHLLNFTAGKLGGVPRRASKLVSTVTTTILQIADSVIKKVHLDGLRQAIWREANFRVQSITLIPKQLIIRATDYLEQLAILVNALQQQREELKKEETPPAMISVSKSVPIPLPPPPSPKEKAINKNQNSNKVAQDKDTLRPPTMNNSQLKASNRNFNKIHNGESAVKT